MKSLTRATALTFGLVLCSAQFALAQDEEAEAPVVEQASSDPETIVVTGQRTLRSLINEAARETEAFYSRLNEVLDDPDFEINCRIEYPVGSNIATRVCRMRYMEDLMSRQALSQIQGLGTTDTEELVFNGVEYDTVTEAMVMQQRFEDELLQAVNTDPVLNEQVVRLLQLKSAVDNYESPREERRRLRQEAEND